MLFLRFGRGDVQLRLQLTDAFLVRTLQRLESAIDDLEAHLGIAELRDLQMVLVVCKYALRLIR